MVFFYFNIYNYCHILFSESEEPNYDNEFMGGTGKILLLFLLLLNGLTNYWKTFYYEINLLSFAHVVLIYEGLWFKSEFSA